jgi:hypothetical protein
MPPAFFMLGQAYQVRHMTTKGIKEQTLINRVAQMLEHDHIHIIGIKYQAGNLWS